MNYELQGQKLVEYNSENKNNIIFNVSFLQRGLFYIITNIPKTGLY